VWVVVLVVLGVVLVVGVGGVVLVEEEEEEEEERKKENQEEGNEEDAKAKMPRGRPKEQGLYQVNHRSSEMSVQGAAGVTKQNQLINHDQQLPLRVQRASAAVATQKIRLQQAEEAVSEKTWAANAAAYAAAVHQQRNQKQPLAMCTLQQAHTNPDTNPNQRTGSGAKRQRSQEKSEEKSRDEESGNCKRARTGGQRVWEENENERAIIGARFLDEGCEWVVLDVGFEAKAAQVVAWYYRSDCTKSEEQLRVDIDQPEVEHSSFREVKEWIDDFQGRKERA
jgi:hypothetical protein